MPGITYMAKFTTSRKAAVSRNMSFPKFLDYIARKTAENRDAIINHALEPERQLAVQESMMQQNFSRYLQYMQTYREDSVNLFSAAEDVLTKESSERIKDVFARSQENGGILWQQVFSFDNDFLQEYGLRNAGYVDEAKLHAATRNAMSALLQHERMESAAWVASIHHNTDNLHIHVAIVEPDPGRTQRESILYKGESQEKGAMRMKSLRIAKSAFANTVMSFQKEHEKINDLIRKSIAADIEPGRIAMSEIAKKEYKDVYASLPEDLRAARYNNVAMTNQRPKLDAVTQNYINTYHRADYKELLDSLDKLNDKYKEIYGSSPSQYREGRLKDLFARCGNRILSIMRDDKKTERFLSSDKSSMYYGTKDPEKFLENRWALTEEKLGQVLEENVVNEIEANRLEAAEYKKKSIDSDWEMKI